jgi:hypothetical protein
MYLQPEIRADGELVSERSLPEVIEPAGACFNRRAVRIDEAHARAF